MPPISARDDEGEFIVGGAEIRVTGSAGVTFAAPDMIIHYVTDHGYRPPDEFLDDLRRSLNAEGAGGWAYCRIG